MRTLGWGRLCGVATGLVLGGAACESGVTVDVTWRVPEGVAAGYPPEAPGVLVSGEDAVLANVLAPVCGAGVDFVEYSDGFGCRPDEHDVTLEGWVVPMPAGWIPALCGPEATGDGGGWLDPELYPLEELPAPTGDDPYGATQAHWKWTPVCGGVLRAEVVIEP